MKRLKLFSAALAAMMPFAMALPAIAGQPAEASSDEQQGGKKKITVRTTGDSTAANQSEESNKRGWAQMFQQFLNENATVVNTAKSGTSSKSFYPEYWSQKTKPYIEPGDYVFIQFGHNDEKAGGMDGDTLLMQMHEAGRDDLAQANEALSCGTSPMGAYRKYIQKYIDETRAAGGIPIVFTPICRNQWTDGKVRRSAKHDLGDGCATAFNTEYDGSGDMYVRGTAPLGDPTYDYAANAIDVAKANGVDYIDLTSITASMMEEMGQTAVSKIWFCQDTTINGVFHRGDGTHPSPLGASLIARAAAKALKEKGIMADYLNIDAAIMVNPNNSYDFGKGYLGSSVVKEFSVAGYELQPAQGNITITATEGYEVGTATDGQFASTLTLPYSSANLPFTYFYVKASPRSEGDNPGSITITNGDDATAVTVQLNVAGLNIEGGSETLCLWPLQKNTKENCTVTGACIGYPETFSNTYAQNYAGDMTWPEGDPYNQTKPSIQCITIEGDKWPTNEIDEASDRYAQFVVEAPQGSALYIDSISFYITSRGSNGMCAKVQYSTDPSFATPQTILYQQGFNAKHPEFVSAKPVIELAAGEKLYVRVLPWSTSGKGTLALCDMAIHGVVKSGTTAISNATAANAETAMLCYDLAGRCLGSAPTAKGIYIKGGNK